MGNDLVASLRGGVLVSCQATPGGALDEPALLATLAAAAEEGGARGFRVDTPATVRAVRARSRLPIIGIHKLDVPGFEVRITPTLESALALAAAGAPIVALDATGRPRPDGVPLAEVVSALHDRGVLAMADLARAEEAPLAIAAGVDILACTLAGYTRQSADLDMSRPATGLIRELATHGLPVVAEGRIWTLDDARACFDAGAWALVIGTAITAPDKITRRFVAGIDPTRSAVT